MLCLGVVPLILALCANGDPKQVPEPLILAIRARMSFKTAHFVYRRTESWSDRPLLVTNHEAWFDGDDVILIDKGDDDGIRMRDPQSGRGMLGVMGACGELKTVFNRNRNELWSNCAGYPYVGLQRNPWRAESSDIRCFGLSSREIQDTTPAQMLARVRGYQTARWGDKLTEHGIHRVVAEFVQPQGSRYNAVEWLIEPARDYAIPEVYKYEIGPDGSMDILSHLTADYARQDGRWWPKRIESSAPRTGWHVAVEFSRVEFDRPNHPKSFGGESLGVPPGTLVTGPEFVDSETPHFGVYAGANEVLSQEQWEQIKGKFDLKSLESYQSERSGIGMAGYPMWWNDTSGLFGLSEAPFTPDEWEAYVRRWLIHHTAPVENPGMPPARINAAWSILKECRKKADPIRRRSDVAAKNISERLRVMDSFGTAGWAASRPASTRVEPQREALHAELMKQLGELQQPAEIQQVFHELCARLNSLLDDSQAASTLPGTVEPHGSKRN